MKLKYLTDEQSQLIEKMEEIFTHNCYGTISTIKALREYNNEEEREILNILRKHYIEWIEIHGNIIPKNKPHLIIEVSIPQVNPITGKYVLREIMNASGSRIPKTYRIEMAGCIPLA